MSRAMLSMVIVSGTSGMYEIDAIMDGDVYYSFLDAKMCWLIHSITICSTFENLWTSLTWIW